MTAASASARRLRRRRGLGDRLYAVLVQAYPAGLREEYGEEMIGMFRAQREAAAGRPLRHARLWALAVLDVAVHAFGEHRATRRGQAGLPRAAAATRATRGGGNDPHDTAGRHGPAGPPHATGPGRRLAVLLRALVDDLGYALRTLLRRPKVTATATVILALGVGTSTAVFGVVDATLLRPLPYRDAGRLVDLWMFLPDRDISANGILLESVRAWRSQRVIFEQVEGYDGATAVITGGGEPERLSTAVMSAGLLEMLGVQPVLGRGFRADDVAPGAAPVILIGEGLWHRRFGASPDVLGEELRLDEEVVTIVGVLPESFRFPNQGTVAWRPLPLEPGSEWEDTATINAVGRLRPGLSLERAGELAEAAGAELQETLRYPHVRLHPWEDLRTSDETRSSLLMLLGAVGFLVLIAAANLANLLLAQATARRNEIAVRAALGAGRARMARQVLAESALLALLGGALGVLLAGVLLRVAMSRIPSSIVNRLAGGAGGIAVDERVALFGIALSLAIGFAMSVLPASGWARGGPMTALGGAHRTGGSRDQARARNVLVVAEVGLSLLLLVGAGLMVNSFVRLQDVDPGFDPDNLLLVELRLDPSRYATQAERTRMADELDRLIEALPGVAGATVGGDDPPVPGGLSFGIAPEAEGMPPAPFEDTVLPYGHAAPDWFDVVGIPFVAGGTFSTTPAAAASSVIINEAVADHYWGDVNPVGKRFRRDADDEWLTVVGVVADVRAFSPDDPYGPMEIYYPLSADERSTYRTFAVRALGDPMGLVEAVKAQLWSLDPDQPVSFQRAADVLAGRVEVPRFYLQLIAVFAFIAAVLAAFGLYGVMSYTVGRRVHEIGIRMALGESERGILRRVVCGGLLLASIGVVLGLAGAAALSRYLESLLYEVSPVDPPTFAAAALLMLLISALACYLPARRATRVDPVEALRAE